MNFVPEQYISILCGYTVPQFTSDNKFIIVHRRPRQFGETSPFLSANTKSLMRARDNAKCKAVKTKYLEDFNEYKKLRNRVNSAVKADKLKSTKESIAKANDPKSLWNTVKKLTGNSESSSPTELVHEGNVFHKAIDIADVLNDFFVKKVENLCSMLEIYKTEK